MTTPVRTRPAPLASQPVWLRTCLLALQVLLACSRSGELSPDAIAPSPLDAAKDAPDAAPPPLMDAADAAPDSPPLDALRATCRDDLDCRDNELGLRVCDADSGRCVQCVPGREAACSAEEYCSRMLRCLRGCRDDRSCEAVTATPYCDRRADPQVCAECVTDAHCAAPGAAGRCVERRCELTCDRDLGDCDRALTNGCETRLDVTLAHCGRCANRCPERPNAASLCVGGACTHRCSTGFLDCNGDPTDGCEVDAGASLEHCGACNNGCAPRPNQTAACAEGSCRRACAAGFADCDGAEANGCETSLASPAHCGACGRACPAAAPFCDEVAGSRTCVNRCAAGELLCSGACVDPQTSVAHCGGCGAACPARPNAAAACADGRCRAVCSAGFGDCDGDGASGCEADLMSSGAHCGRCSAACGAGFACTRGTCTRTCPTGQTLCGTTCVDTRTDDQHCGACGRACAAGSTCASGTCVTACEALTRGGHRYYFCPRSATWTSARAECQRFGAALASLNDAEEMAWLNVETARRNPAGERRTYWWISANDRDAEGTFMQADAPPIPYGPMYSGPGFFCAGEPSNRHGGAECLSLNVVEHCAHLNWLDRGCLNDMPCDCPGTVNSINFYFVCERP